MLATNTTAVNEGTPARPLSEAVERRVYELLDQVLQDLQQGSADSLASAECNIYQCMDVLSAV